MRKRIKKANFLKAGVAAALVIVLILSGQAVMAGGKINDKNLYGKAPLRDIPPIANFTYMPSNPNAGETIIFDGSESYDPDGSIDEYYWYFSIGPPGGPHSTPMPMGFGEILDFSWVDPGDYSVTLKVTDNDGEIGYITKTVHVNQLPIANFTYTPSNPNAGETIIFDGSESYDPDGTIVEFYWSFSINEGSQSTIPIPMGFGEILDFSWVDPGDYSVTLKVTDNDGEIGYITKTIHVELTNHPPILDSIGDKTFILPPILPYYAFAVWFTITASDVDGGNLTLTVDPELPATCLFPVGDNTWRYTLFLPAISWSSRKVTFTVTDDGGLSDSETIKINIVQSLKVGTSNEM